jgi:hypothetical protein
VSATDVCTLNSWKDWWRYVVNHLKNKYLPKAFVSYNIILVSRFLWRSLSLNDFKSFYQSRLKINTCLIDDKNIKKTSAAPRLNLYFIALFSDCSP